MRVLNAAQMREADRRTIEDIGVPSLVLMENAGRQVVAAMEAAFEDLTTRHVAVLCGRGSNGGDGFVVARTLAQRGVQCSVFVLGQIADVRGDARVNLGILGRLDVTVVEVIDAQAWELHYSEISRSDLIVDALFGTGLTTALSGLYETVVAAGVDDLVVERSPLDLDVAGGAGVGGQLAQAGDDEQGRQQAAADEVDGATQGGNTGGVRSSGKGGHGGLRGMRGRCSGYGAQVRAWRCIPEAYIFR